MKNVQKQALYNKLHRGIVTGLVGLTVLGSAVIIHRTYLFFTVTLPKRREMRRLIAEEQLQMEQIEREQELLRRQQEAEMLPS